MATWFYGGTSHYGGPWANAWHRYLGLKFHIKGKVHYGWARLNVQWKNLTATLTGYAYETVPGESIITGGESNRRPQQAEQPSPVALAAPPPKPATLGLLAMGASGSFIWRRKESALQGN